MHIINILKDFQIKNVTTGKNTYVCICMYVCLYVYVWLRLASNGMFIYVIKIDCVTFFIINISPDRQQLPAIIVKCVIAQRFFRVFLFSFFFSEGCANICIDFMFCKKPGKWRKQILQRAYSIFFFIHSSFCFLSFLLVGRNIQKTTKLQKLFIV